MDSKHLGRISGSWCQDARVGQFGAESIPRRCGFTYRKSSVWSARQTLNVDDLLQHTSKSYDYHFSSMKTESQRVKNFPRSLTEANLETPSGPVFLSEMISLLEKLGVRAQ